MSSDVAVPEESVLSVLLAGRAFLEPPGKVKGAMSSSPTSKSSIFSSFPSISKLPCDFHVGGDSTLSVSPESGWFLTNCLACLRNSLGFVRNSEKYCRKTNVRNSARNVGVQI